MTVPKKMQPVYDAAAPALRAFCDTCLDGENAAYLDLCLKALEKLCRMRPSPLLSGRLRTWVAGIAYFICAQNDRFVASCPKRLNTSEIAGFFGLSVSTASNQANIIRRLFGVLNYDERVQDLFHLVDDPWRLPSTDAMMKMPKPAPNVENSYFE
ncbi:MAG: hypothetical protein IJ769_04350 [Clostridia bacterium]|nr:hypothetical protein [Clostridia bacterium]